MKTLKYILYFVADIHFTKKGELLKRRVYACAPANNYVLMYKLCFLSTCP